MGLVFLYKHFNTPVLKICSIPRNWDHRDEGHTLYSLEEALIGWGRQRAGKLVFFPLIVFQWPAPVLSASYVLLELIL